MDAGRGRQEDGACGSLREEESERNWETQQNCQVVLGVHLKRAVRAVQTISSLKVGSFQRVDRQEPDQGGGGEGGKGKRDTCTPGGRREGGTLQVAEVSGRSCVRGNVFEEVGRIQMVENSS